MKEKNIGEEIFLELKDISEKLLDKGLSEVDKTSFLIRKEHLMQEFQKHCASGKITSVSTLSNLTSPESPTEINYVSSNSQLALDGVIKLANNKDILTETSVALNLALNEVKKGRSK